MKKLGENRCFRRCVVGLLGMLGVMLGMLGVVLGMLGVMLGILGSKLGFGPAWANQRVHWARPGLVLESSLGGSENPEALSRM